MLPGPLVSGTASTSAPGKAGPRHSCPPDAPAEAVSTAETLDKCPLGSTIPSRTIVGIVSQLVGFELTETKFTVTESCLDQV